MTNIIQNFDYKQISFCLGSKLTKKVLVPIKLGPFGMFSGNNPNAYVDIFEMGIRSNQDPPIPYIEYFSNFEEYGSYENNGFWRIFNDTK